MTLAVMTLVLMFLPLAGDTAIAVPAVIVPLLVQLSLVAWSIDYLRHEAAVEALHNLGRRAGDRA